MINGIKIWHHNTESRFIGLVEFSMIINANPHKYGNIGRDHACECYVWSRWQWSVRARMVQNIVVISDDPSIMFQHHGLDKKWVEYRAYEPNKVRLVLLYTCFWLQRRHLQQTSSVPDSKPNTTEESCKFDMAMPCSASSSFSAVAPAFPRSSALGTSKRLRSAATHWKSLKRLKNVHFGVSIPRPRPARTRFLLQPSKVTAAISVRWTCWSCLAKPLCISTT